jgi:hypothetical protein
MSRRTDKQARARMVRDRAAAMKKSGQPAGIPPGNLIVSVDLFDPGGHRLVRTLYRLFPEDDRIALVEPRPGYVGWVPHADGTGASKRLAQGGRVDARVSMSWEQDGDEWTRLWFKCEACRDDRSVFSEIGMDEIERELDRLAALAQIDGKPRHARLATHEWSAGGLI